MFFTFLTTLQTFLQNNFVNFYSWKFINWALSTDFQRQLFRTTKVQKISARGAASYFSAAEICMMHMLHVGQKVPHRKKGQVRVKILLSKWVNNTILATCIWTHCSHRIPGPSSRTRRRIVLLVYWHLWKILHPSHRSGVLSYREMGSRCTHSSPQIPGEPQTLSGSQFPRDPVSSASVSLLLPHRFRTGDQCILDVRKCSCRCQICPQGGSAGRNQHL